MIDSDWPRGLDESKFDSGPVYGWLYNVVNATDSESMSTTEADAKVSELVEQHHKQIRYIAYSVAGIFAIILMFAIIFSCLYYYKERHKSKTLDELNIEQITADATFNT